MELTHRFTVPTGVEVAWAHFNDIASVAECFPGAQVTSVDGETFSGSVKVKLGPIALVYNGTGTFLEKDEAAHRFKVEAKGKDKRGNGTAGAHVTLTMTPAGDGGEATDVEVLTDLAITGKPAQFGRGVMQDVSDKLLGQFMDCLEQRLGESPAETPAEPAVVESEAPVVEPAETPAADEVAPVASVPGPRGPSPSERMASAAPPPPRPSADHMDLGATVLPVLARSYWKQGLGALLVLLLVWRWVRRGG